jgi:cytochrome oxidase Cu insertion factor (SCO1/SenC/PrrC family)
LDSVGVAGHPYDCGVTATARWGLFATIPLVAVLAVALTFVFRSSGGTHTTSSMTPPASTEAAATWAAGQKKAPPIVLRNENGRPVSLAALRGRPVLVTFIDPLCRDFCPIEAQHLSDAVRGASVKPTILAVSVNTAGNAPHNLTLDMRKWGVVPQWTWGVGSSAQLSRVWKRYGIDVIVTHKKLAGVTVQQVAHTEAAYLIDANGWERAVFVWPYTASAVTKALAATS